MTAWAGVDGRPARRYVIHVDRRLLAVALLVAIAAGFAGGWCARHARQRTLDERLEETRDQIRHRTDELVH